LLFGLLAAASAAGAWTAFVGFPDLGLVAASDAGLSLDRVAVVPAPGIDAPTVIAALVDGIDVVALGPSVALLDADRRRLAARVRERGCVLVASGPWAGAQVSLTAQGGAWWGADDGMGWLRRRTLRVRRDGRAMAGPTELTVEVPVTPAGPPALRRSRDPLYLGATGQVRALYPERGAPVRDEIEWAESLPRVGSVA
jgi:hypothetical protein